MRTLTAVAILVALSGCAVPQVATAPPLVPAPPVASWTAPQADAIRVPLTERGGTPTVDVCIAHVCGIPFVVDSGATDVSVTPELFKAMVAGGHITQDDLIDVQRYRTASGAVIEGLRFRMPPMTVGGRTVHNVIGSVSPGATMLLLGQSFLRRFKSVTVDNAAGVLVLS